MSALSPRRRLGIFEILSPWARGGMGEVYRARDTRLERDVAIKVLPASLSSDSARKQRLEREAKAISKLSHPHICALDDIGPENGVDSSWSTSKARRSSIGSPKSGRMAR